VVLRQFATFLIAFCLAIINLTFEVLLSLRAESCVEIFLIVLRRFKRPPFFCLAFLRGRTQIYTQHFVSFLTVVVALRQFATFLIAFCLAIINLTFEVLRNLRAESCVEIFLIVLGRLFNRPFFCPLIFRRNTRRGPRVRNSRRDSWQDIAGDNPRHNKTRRPAESRS